MSCAQNGAIVQNYTERTWTPRNTLEATRSGHGLAVCAPSLLRERPTRSWSVLGLAERMRTHVTVSQLLCQSHATPERKQDHARVCRGASHGEIARATKQSQNTAACPVTAQLCLQLIFRIRPGTPVNAVCARRSSGTCVQIEVGLCVVFDELDQRLQAAIVLILNHCTAERS